MRRARPLAIHNLVEILRVRDVGRPHAAGPDGTVR
jgi:hypothetical protein